MLLNLSPNIARAKLPFIMLLYTSSDICGGTHVKRIICKLEDVDEEHINTYFGAWEVIPAGKEVEKALRLAALALGIFLPGAVWRRQAKKWIV